MAGFYSFISTLERVCRENNPKRILEWGPGRSTRAFLDSSDAEIHSIEHLHKWFESALDQFKDEPRVTLYYKTEEDEYCEPEFPEKFDLIFVDGLCAWRVHCLNYAPRLLAPGGVVILHDSERDIYNPGREGYVTVSEEDGTAVMKPVLLV